MADDDDLEYSETNVSSAQSQGVRKNISLKLKGKGRGKRSRRAAPSKKGSGAPEDLDISANTETSLDGVLEKSVSDAINLDAVISKLDTPSFSPMDRAFPEPLHQNKKLRWDHKVNLIGEKVINPMFHCCEKCSLPILNYGRMIPCKHICCYDCAKKANDVCPKCAEDVQRVEPTALGTVFMCTYGSSRHGPVACGRTYLSQRDLQAHINHRHNKPAAAAIQVSDSQSVPMSEAITSHHPIARDPRDPRVHAHESLAAQSILITHAQHALSHAEHRDQNEHCRSPAMAPNSSDSPAAQTRQYPHSPANFPSTIPVSSARPNLITVQIQDDSSTPSQHVQVHAQPYTPPTSTPVHALPPLQHPPNTYPLPHAFQHPLPAPNQTYSQAPPINTQTFTQPPPVYHPPPPICAPGTPLYPTPPPQVHHPPPATYNTTPGVPPHASHPLPPQRFPGAGGYEENSYMPSWTSSAPPPSRTPILPTPRPITAPPLTGMGHLPQRGISEPGYPQSYYQ